MSAAVDCRLWTRLARARRIRFARASAPARRRPRPAFGWRSSGRAPPTIQRRQIPVPIPPRSINIACGAGIPSVSVAGVNKASRSASTALICPSSSSSSIELTADLTLEMRRQGTAIARLQLAEPLASIATQRLVAGDTLGEQQSFDPVDVLDPLDCQRLALAASAVGDRDRLIREHRCQRQGLSGRRERGAADLAGRPYQGRHRCIASADVSALQGSGFGGMGSGHQAGSRWC